MDRLKSATATQLEGEWNLCVLSFRTANWSGGEDKTRLVTRLRECLVEDGLVLTLLCSAVNYAYYNGHAEKRLFCNGLVEAFGEGLADAVDGVDDQTEGWPGPSELLGYCLSFMP